MANTLQRLFQVISRKAQPKNLVPATTYSGYPMQNWFGGIAKSGEQVTEKTASRLATYYACIRNISEDLSKLPYVVFTTDKNGNKQRVNNARARQILQVKPNNYSSPFSLKESLFKDAISRGNGYAYIVRDKDGLPTEMHYIDSNFVYPEFDLTSKRLFYTINYIPLGLNGTYTSDEIFHLKGQGNTMVGSSVLSYQLESLGHAIAVQNYSSNYFKDGASMSGLLTFAGVNDEKKLQQYINMFLGSFEKGGIGAGPEGMTFTQMNNNPQNSQFIETENLIRGEIARWFRMPLSKLQDLSDTNNNALEQVNINYVTDCLMPWIVRFEQEADQKLYASFEREIYDGYIDTEMLLRGDSAAMERKVRTMFTSGGIKPDEVRKMYGLNTIGDEYSNTTYVPSNMIPGGEAIEFWKMQAEKNKKVTQSEPGQGGVQQ